MLPGVLLHVLESARPIDDTVHIAGFDPALHDMQDGTIVSVDDIHDRRGSEPSCVERLSARCRVERRSIEDGGGAPVVHLDAQHARIELGHVGVVVIQTLGQRATSRVTGSVMPACANPRARSRQLSQRPHGAPDGNGS
jgi:hypothetical protein